MRNRRRVLGWIAGALAVLGVPAASGASVFVGGTKQHVICPGLGHTDERTPFTLTMDPGFTLGTLTYAGGAPIDMVTNWTADGRGGAFTASGILANGGQISLYGWTRGAKMKGWVMAQSYAEDECLTFGVLRAWAQ
jgi:hypothetical protein